MTATTAYTIRLTEFLLSGTIHRGRRLEKIVRDTVVLSFITTVSAL